jgi:hypothetical protein
MFAHTLLLHQGRFPSCIPVQNLGSLLLFKFMQSRTPSQVFVLNFRVRSMSYLSATFTGVLLRTGKFLGADAKASNLRFVNFMVQGVP